MFSLIGTGYAQSTSGFPGNNSRSPDKGPYQSRDQSAERLTNQVNIQTATEQDLSSAVTPVIKSDALRNHQLKAPHIAIDNELNANKQTSSVPSNLQSSTSKETSEVQNSEKQPEELNNDKASDGEKLTEEEQKQVDDLKKRDAEVRAHEQSHAAVGGSYASSPSYEFETGPDNKQYAVAGEVQIDAAPIPNNPKATIEKMDIVIRAALAPADPSSQDKKVASQAQKNRTEAQAELAKQQAANQNGEDEEGGSPLNAGQDKNTDKSQLPSQEILAAITAYQNANNLVSSGSRN